ncbi:NAD(P)-dependent dehydrogenase (short-subunit alcohol dehydrogenase family) [Clostridium acetobutylicum]|uniref:Predicted oxidoreductase, ortholog of GSP39 B.subtilis n=1 Tax=Clostridium acetobutylicum (strain ATCC 824 / DSM 792 / JCM 1419 / IAM 19013 / LMG 5710 / NBRC 13948 / NRRL B-527 / VKM B-1787 / 2291 / W) TaxID=272562 RepID=Q97IR4_CLOAB|nr:MULTISPECIES: SDR family oxidoreductase [Clostridium]AAK79543.1 Predicted oxidoreductase, ortholog of GSP39 B.subtilis [Clostridium acetobutylicum ATCC 824]ADZ20628.1 oxidoreductase [Clostridium acetobutylicum EA 2018]AEI34107.1 oxidoreductase [Clostridium acetobutylicum DSM 1731]AWV81214.1 NAD(P)-dependent oxidoreductase [Clostridium acetobutylicum]MBC2392845.1 SDR family oxidoreductase [Clostridium acetobutylicum]
MNFPNTFPKQHQNHQPGYEYEMNPAPIYYDEKYNKSRGLLKGKTAIITGGDSGIGRAVSVAYAHEGADVVIIYYDEHQDADETKKIIDGLGRKCTLMPGDIGDTNFCNYAIENTIRAYDKIDILVNNAAMQYPQNSIADISNEQFDRTFKTNVYGTFYMTRAAISKMKAGSSIINTTSVVAFKGNETLIDYSMTKGAILAFTKSLSTSLVKSGIRVNAVAPGPIWTPLISASFDENKVSEFGSNVPLERPGQPVECAGAYVFLASEMSSYITGQTIHVNGGEIVM